MGPITRQVLKLGWEGTKTLVSVLYTILVFANFRAELLEPTKGTALVFLFVLIPGATLVTWDIFMIDRKIGLSELATTKMGRFMQTRALLGALALMGAFGQFLCLYIP